MSTYDFTAAARFLDEIGATPRDIKDEIDYVMGDMARDRFLPTVRHARVYSLLSVLTRLVGRIGEAQGKEVGHGMA